MVLNFQDRVISEVAELTNLSQEKATKIVESIIFVMLRCLANKNMIVLRGFGTLRWIGDKIKFFPAIEMKALVNKHFLGPKLKYPKRALTPYWYAKLKENPNLEIPDTYYIPRKKKNVNRNCVSS